MAEDVMLRVEVAHENGLASEVEEIMEVYEVYVIISWGVVKSC